MITAKTKVCVIVGDPIEHSLSPMLHGAAYEAMGVSFVSVAARIRSGDMRRAVEGMRSMGFRGMACTLPHKEAVREFLDEIDPLAASIGAVNTVVQGEDGRLMGYNTDVLGVLLPLRRVAAWRWGEAREAEGEGENKAGGILVGRRVAILGAGGTARAAAWGLRAEGAKVTIYNRTLERAERLAREIGVEAERLEARERLGEAEVIINTTSVGMSPDVGASPVSAAIFRRGQVVMDAIYTPPRTRFLREAEEAGASVISGLWMFLEQARAQIALFTGQEPPEEVLQRCLWRHLGLEMGEFSLFPEESTWQ